MSYAPPRWNIETYNAAKKQMIDNIQSGTKTIILFGGGGNGKSHLTEDVKELLQENNYNVYRCDDTYSWSKSDFIKDINNNTNKKIQHFLFHPFKKWDIACNHKNTTVINMGI